MKDSVLQCVAVCCSVLQCVAVRCSVLQCVAVCCSVLQCVAMRCSVLGLAYDDENERQRKACPKKRKMACLYDKCFLLIFVIGLFWAYS